MPKTTSAIHATGRPCNQSLIASESCGRWPAAERNLPGARESSSQSFGHISRQCAAPPQLAQTPSRCQFPQCPWEELSDPPELAPEEHAWVRSRPHRRIARGSPGWAVGELISATGEPGL